MNSKTMTKVIAAFLAFILSFANVLLLGSYANNVYAVSSNLEEQNKTVSKAKIEFDAYFQNEVKEITHYKNIDEEDKTLYLSIKVQEGYLTAAEVKIEDANFKVLENTKQFDIIQTISSEENKITLNQINKDESVILKLPIEIKADSSFDVKDLSKQGTVILEGTYVNNRGKETKVKKEIKVEVSVDGTAESELKTEVIKYVPFNVNGKKGVILQTSVKSKLIDNKLPIKTTKLEIEIPKINNIMPTKTILAAKSTRATNGEQGRRYNENEYKIEDGKITLEIQNNEEMLSWLKNAEDEIVFTFVYSEEAIADKAELNLNAKSEITYYAKELKTVKTEVKQNAELSEKIGDLVTTNVNTSKEKLYKGYMLAEKGPNTEFETKLDINIGYSELIDKIAFKEETSYVDKNGNVYPSNAIYRSTKISEKSLKEILGEEGYINIYNNAGEKITTLNKDKLSIDYEKEEKGLIFETSKPIFEGILEIENVRYIKPLEYSKLQEDMFTAFRINLVTNVVKDNEKIISATKTKELVLENPKTQAKIEISEPNISTMVKAEGVELRVTLKTTGEDTALYKNPTIEIVMPKYITNVDVENVKLVYEKELKILEAQKIKNAEGNIVIRITLEGEQTAYNNEWITEGATIIMNTNLTVNTLTPTKQEKIFLNVKNENVSEDITENADIFFIAPAGIATVSQIMNYKNAGDIVTTIGSKQGIGEIAAKAPAKTVKMQIAAINNYTYDLENVVILGRIPFEGNKNVVNGKDLGSTFTAKLMSGIKAETGLTEEQITVYYSANGEATSDINDINNTWITDINLVNDIKSYMIVLNNYTLKTGEMIGFSYTAELPANLERNANTFGTYAIYYERKQESENIQNNLTAGVGYAMARPMQTATGAPVGLSTGTGPDLSVELKSDLEAGKKITTSKTIKVTAEVKNNSIMPAENVNVKVELPNNMYYAAPNNKDTDISEKEVNLVIPNINSRRN